MFLVEYLIRRHRNISYSISSIIPCSQHNNYLNLYSILSLNYHSTTVSRQHCYILTCPCPHQAMFKPQILHERSICHLIIIKKNLLQKIILPLKGADFVLVADMHKRKNEQTNKNSGAYIGSLLPNGTRG